MTAFINGEEDMALTVRTYEAADADALLQILAANTPRYFAVNEYADFEDYLRNGLDWYFVLLDDEKVIGGAGINRHIDEGIVGLSWGFIHPDYHGQGGGSLLLKHRLAVLQNQPYHLARVKTSQLVQAFFAKHGFNVVRTQKDYWGEGLDLWEMHLPLSTMV